MRFHHHPGARRRQHTAGSTSGPGCRPWRAVADRPGRQWPHSTRSGPREGSVSWSPGSSRIRWGGGGGDGFASPGSDAHDRASPSSRRVNESGRPGLLPAPGVIGWYTHLSWPEVVLTAKSRNFAGYSYRSPWDLPVGQVIFGRLHPTRHICKIWMGFRPIGLPGQPFGGAMTT